MIAYRIYIVFNFLQITRFHRKYILVTKKSLNKRLIQISIMSAYTTNNTNTQNYLLMKNLMEFYKDRNHLHKMMRIINGESKISLRIVDWFVTNFAKKNYTVYELLIPDNSPNNPPTSVRFKVYNDYKLKLKSYSKKRFDPFCRWERITIPYDEEKCMETTIGQLNFFKWAIENNIIEYIDTHYDAIESDMNSRNSTSKRKHSLKNSSIVSNELVETDFFNSNNNNTHENHENHEKNDSSDTLVINGNDSGKTRKKREELSVSACKCIKKETVNITVKFN